MSRYDMHSNTVGEDEDEDEEPQRSLIETLTVAEKRLDWALESLEDLDSGVAGGARVTSNGASKADPWTTTLVTRAENIASLSGRLADRIATLRSIVLGPEVAQSNARD